MRVEKEAVMQAVHVLNTVTVPMGLQLGTDSGKGSGEGGAATRVEALRGFQVRIIPNGA